jgi:type I restriction enzyme, S subunit
MVLVMQLSKLGDFIELSNEKNRNLEFGKSSLRGISQYKHLFKTKINMDGVDLSSYNVVKTNEFCFKTMTARNGGMISIGLNTEDDPVIVYSSWVSTFRIKDINQLHPYYLMMFFKRPEFDRYAIFNSAGSVREKFSFENMCDVELYIPSMEVQQKVVDVYLTMVANQKAYESGLEDLKLACEAYIVQIGKNLPKQRIEKHIEKVKSLNTDATVTQVKGVSAVYGFIETKANLISVDILKYQIVRHGDFAFTPTRINIGSIALMREEECVVSPFYEIFRVKSNELLPEYLLLWLKRKEFYRWTLFKSDNNVRQTFSFSEMLEVEIPIPSISIQKDIVKVYEAYEVRKKINENLKKHINEICPVLIKGSIYLSK